MFGPKQSYSPEGEDTSDTGVVDPESGTDTTTTYYEAPAIVRTYNPDIIYPGLPQDIMRLMKEGTISQDTVYYRNPADSIFMIRRPNNTFDHYR
jgi:hypothetical protein